MNRIKIYHQNKNPTTSFQKMIQFACLVVMLMLENPAAIVDGRLSILSS